MDRINQMNILRESNAMLRAESEAHARKARQLETTLAQLQVELGPLKEESKVARAELEEKNKQIGRLEKENLQWKERNSQLLTKVCQSNKVIRIRLILHTSMIVSIPTMFKRSVTRSTTCKSILRSMRKRKPYVRKRPRLALNWWALLRCDQLLLLTTIYSWRTPQRTYSNLKQNMSNWSSNRVNV